MIVVCVILKKALIIFIHNYLRCCEIPQGFISNSSNISDYVKIVEIILTQPRFTLNRFPCEEMREWKQRVQKLHRFDVETTQKNLCGNLINIFVDFESRIQVEISTRNRCHNFHMDSPFKIDEISTNFPRGISTSDQW